MTVEMVEALRDLDEVTLLELLDIRSVDLVDAFLDKIKEKEGYLAAYLYD